MSINVGIVGCGGIASRHLAATGNPMQKSSWWRTWIKLRCRCLSAATAYSSCPTCSKAWPTISVISWISFAVRALKLRSCGFSSEVAKARSGDRSWPMSKACPRPAWGYPPRRQNHLLFCTTRTHFQDDVDSPVLPRLCSSNSLSRCRVAEGESRWQSAKVGRFMAFTTSGKPPLNTVQKDPRNRSLAIPPKIWRTP